MRIYTKTGDKGETSLFGGKRVKKNTLRIETYGTVDELNSVIGICRSINTDKKIDAILEIIQNDLFTLGTDLSTSLEIKNKKVKRIQTTAITHLEQLIDKIESQLKPLKQFILPGGNNTAAMLHFARTICRRAERLVVQLSQKESVGENPTIYLNRLSDLLFVLARWSNYLSGTTEYLWKH